MSASVDEAPVATVDGVPRLIGARCSSCGTHTFPQQGACPRCGSSTEAAPLPLEGSLWSWTVQRIEPKPPYRGPVAYEPFAVGYVDLGVVRVESTLGGRAVDAWSIGDPVHLVVDEVDTDGVAWSFRFEGDRL